MKVVGITSCTVGIAHTYMAREKLISAGEKLGWDVKIEAQGSGGVEFKLTQEEIDDADFVLIASDVTTDGTERFKDKPLIKVPISVALKSPEGLLLKIEKQINRS